jgi:predicted enzyme related to lactoylglutathione lyase
MTSGMKTVIYPVHDLADAKRLYADLLGVAPSMDEVYYVGFDIGAQHIGLDPNGRDKGMTGPLGYWHVDDIKVRVESLVELGAEVRQDITDVGGGKLIATVTDADGNPIGLLQDPAGS